MSTHDSIVVNNGSDCLIHIAHNFRQFAWPAYAKRVKPLEDAMLNRTSKDFIQTKIIGLNAKDSLDVLGSDLIRELKKINKFSASTNTNNKAS